MLLELVLRTFDDRLNTTIAPVRGILEQVMNKVSKAADTVSGHSIRGFASGIFPSQVGLKTMNSIGIQNALSDNLSTVRELLPKLDSLPTKGAIAAVSAFIQKAGIPLSVIAGKAIANQQDNKNGNQ